MFQLGGATICLGIIIWFFIKPPSSRGTVAILCLAVLFIGLTPGATKVRDTVGNLINTTNTTVDKTVTTP